MVSLKTVIFAVALPALAATRIISLEAPPTATRGSAIQLTFNTMVNVQNWAEYGLIVGMSPAKWACKTCIGQQIEYLDLL